MVSPPFCHKAVLLFVKPSLLAQWNLWFHDLLWILLMKHMLSIKPEHHVYYVYCLELFSNCIVFLGGLWAVSLLKSTKIRPKEGASLQWGHCYPSTVCPRPSQIKTLLEICSINKLDQSRTFLPEWNSHVCRWPNTAFKHKKLIPSVKYVGSIILIWACFAAAGPGPHVIIDSELYILNSAGKHQITSFMNQTESGS